MQEKLLKISTILLAVTIAAAAAVLNEYSVRLAAEEETHNMSVLERLDYYTAQADKEGTVFEQQLRLELPQGTELADILVEQDYLHHLVTVKLPELEDDYFQEHPLLGKSSHIADLYMEQGMIEITLDSVYETECTVEDGYLFLDFVKPKEMYQSVVVIDAGHGGKAPGATKQGILEKDLNLGIAMKLRTLLEETDQNIGVYYTREEDKNPSFEQRVQLANEAEADLFISIHNNSTADGVMSSVNGTEVMYDEKKSEEGLSDRHLAEICLEETTAALGSKNNGLTKGNGIFIIRNSMVPAALIEVGFMTNQQELDLLKTEEYQMQAAQGIYNAIMRALAEGY